MKKVGILVPSLTDGGAEKVAANLSLLFEELGYKPYLILYEKRISFKYTGKIIDLKINKNSHKLTKVFKDIKIYRKLKEVKKKYNFDLVISHLPKCDLMNVLTKQNEKVITTVHNNIEVDYPYYMKKLLPFILKKSDLVVPVSKVAEEYLKQMFKSYKDKIVTIYNFQDNKKIHSLGMEPINEKEKYIFDNNQVIVNVGRLDYQKGHWHLIKAFSQLANKKKNVRLLLIGEGKLEKNLKELAKNLGIENKVHFLGFQSNPYKYLANSDLYVSTSVHEGLPMTLIEAMSFSLPIIATDCISGPREIIAPNLGLFDEINYDNDFDYGILVPNFADKDGLKTYELSKYEINLGNQMYDMLNNLDKMRLNKQKSKSRSSDFDKEKIINDWYIQLKRIFERE